MISSKVGCARLGSRARADVHRLLFSPLGRCPRLWSAIRYPRAGFFDAEGRALFSDGSVFLTRLLLSTRIERCVRPEFRFHGKMSVARPCASQLPILSSAARP